MKVTTYIIEDASGTLTLGELIVSYGATLRICYIVSNNSGSTLTVAGAGTDTIDGAASVNLAIGASGVYVGQYGPASDGLWHSIDTGDGGRGCELILFQGTPGGTGADGFSIPAPYDPADGSTSIVWNVRRITLNVDVAGGAPVVTIEKSTAGNAAFGAGTTVGTITFGSGDYVGSVTAALGTVASGNRLRFNVGALGTATGWTISVLLG